MWAAFGFTRNPYGTEPVPPSDDGDVLLVGRDVEVADLTARLTASSTIPVLVGANGVGKTSIFSVAAYRLSRWSRRNGDDGPIYLTLDPPLQLDSAQSLDRFEQDAYYRIAEVLLNETEFLVRHGVKKRQVKALRQWLQNPAARQRTFGVSTPFVGGSVQSGASPNNSEGFRDSGMQRIVEDWLERCFADRGRGGVICLIDNLEILRTSAQARDAVEALRDGLFSMPGLLWVLCGTPAVIGGNALFSARMEGRIASPSTIGPVLATLAPELVARRLERFGSPAAYAPVDGRGFEHIYAVVNSRLRFALSLCQDFALFLYAQGRRPHATERLDVLDGWLAQKATEFAQAASDVPARSWRLFDDLTDVGGEILSREADVCRFNSAEELAAAAASLRRAGLLEQVGIDVDSFVLQVTTPGWLVRYQRKNYDL